MKSVQSLVAVVNVLARCCSFPTRRDVIKDVVFNLHDRFFEYIKCDLVACSNYTVISMIRVLLSSLPLANRILPFSNNLGQNDNAVTVST